MKGEANPGDLFTKAWLTHHRIEALLHLLRCNYREGRPASAPALRHKGTEKKIFKTEKRARWADENESEDEN